MREDAICNKYFQAWLQTDQAKRDFEEFESMAVSSSNMLRRLLTAKGEAWPSHHSGNLSISGYQPHAYGLGKHADGFGRPFQWVEKSSGHPISPITDVTPDAYGLGVGADDFGRVVVPVY